MIVCLYQMVSDCPLYQEVCGCACVSGFQSLIIVFLCVCLPGCHYVNGHHCACVCLSQFDFVDLYVHVSL